MWKILASPMLFFSQPLVAFADEPFFEGGELPGYIGAAAKHVHRDRVGSEIDCNLTANPQLIRFKSGWCVVDNKRDVAGRTQADVPSRDPDAPSPYLADVDCHCRFEGCGVGSLQVDSCNRYPDGREQHAKGRHEADPAVLAEGLKRDAICCSTHIDGSIGGPVDTLFDKLLTFITAASIMAGTIYFVFAVGLARPILTRSWRRDAWIGYLTAIGGFYLMAFTQL